MKIIHIYKVSIFFSYLKTKFNKQEKHYFLILFPYLMIKSNIFKLER